MTDQTSSTASAPWQSTASLITGFMSLLALVIFLTLPSGAFPLLAAAILGAIAIILGIVGVRGSRSKGNPITGIVTGAISLLVSAAIYIFALLLIGALAI